MKFPTFLYHFVLFVFIVPMFARAQSERNIIKDLGVKTLGIASSFKFNDQLGIYQVILNDTTFELVAVDNKMQILWRNQFKGFGIACGKFKGNILAMADSAYSKSNGLIALIVPI